MKPSLCTSRTALILIALNLGMLPTPSQAAFSCGTVLRFFQDIPKLSIRDLFTPKGFVSLHDGRIQKIERVTLPAGQQVEEVRFDSGNYGLLWGSLSADEIRGQLAALPDGASLALYSSNGEVLKGRLQGPPKQRYLEYVRGGRSYHLSVDWKGFSLCLVSNGDFGLVGFLRSDELAARTLGEAPFRYDVSKESFRNGVVSTIEIGTVIRLESAGQKAVEGALIGKNREWLVSATNDTPALAKINWSEVKAITVPRAAALPVVDLSQLKRTETPSQALQGLALRLGMVISLDVGSTEPVVGVVVASGPKIQVIDPKGANQVVDLREIQFNGAVQGFVTQASR